MEREIHICGAKAADDMIFECLDGSFCCIDSVICWLEKLPCTIFFCEIFFERSCCLIVHNIEGWLIYFACKVCEDLVKYFNDCFVFQFFDWNCRNCIGVVIICLKIVLIPLEADGGEGPGGIGVKCAILFV